MQERFPALAALAVQRMESVQDFAKLRTTLFGMHLAQVERDALFYLKRLPDPDDD